MSTRDARPRVIVQQQASLDGRLTLSPDVLLLFGDHRWAKIAGDKDEMGEWLRATHHPQATLEGSGSFVRPDAVVEPLPPAREDPATLYQHYLPEAVLNRPEQRGWFTVVDGRGRVRWAYKEWPSEEWKGWHLLVLVSRRTPPEYLSYLRSETIPYLVAGDGERVDLAEALRALRSELGVTCLLSTAGGELNGALLRAGLVDEIAVEFLPAVIGGKGTPSMFDAPPLGADEHPTLLRLLSTSARDNGAVWLRYTVQDE